MPVKTGRERTITSTRTTRYVTLLSVVLALALTAALAACGSDEPSGVIVRTPTETPASPARTPSTPGAGDAPTATVAPRSTATTAQSTPAVAPTPTPAELPGVETLWRYEVGGRALSPTVMSDGRVYVSIGNNPLSALDVETGELLWQETAAGYYGTASPNVVDGVVYVGLDGRSGSGYLYALNAETGERLWQSRTDTVVRVPTVSDGIVYVATRDHGIVALDAESAVPLRSYEFDFLVEYWPFGNNSPAVTDGILYSALDQGGQWYAFAMDLESGELLWRHEIPGLMSGSPQVQNGVVYVSSSGIIYALNRTSGELLWHFEYGGRRLWHAVYDGIVYVRSGGQTPSENDPFYALDAKTGELLWSYEGGQGFDDHAVSILLDGILYLADGDGNLDALHADSGQVVRSYMNVGIVFSLTAGPDGKLRILGSDGNHIYLLVGDAIR